MNIFATKTVNRVEALRTKSSNAISVFKKTVTDLASANNQILQEERNRKAQKEKLDEEINELKTIRKENTAIIDKVNEFFGVSE